MSATAGARPPKEVDQENDQRDEVEGQQDPGIEEVSRGPGTQKVEEDQDLGDQPDPAVDPTRRDDPAGDRKQER